MKSRKRAQEKAARTTISMPPGMFIKALELQRHAGFPCFSDYVQHLVRADYIRATGKHVAQIEVAA